MAIKKEMLEDLERRRQCIAGEQAKIEARHAKGLMTARERIAGLVDSGSFQESGAHVGHDVRGFG